MSCRVSWFGQCSTDARLRKRAQSQPKAEKRFLAKKMDLSETGSSGPAEAHSEHSRRGMELERQEWSNEAQSPRAVKYTVC